MGLCQNQVDYGEKPFAIYLIAICQHFPRLVSFSCPLGRVMFGRSQPSPSKQPANWICEWSLLTKCCNSTHNFDLGHLNRRDSGYPIASNMNTKFCSSTQRPQLSGDLCSNQFMDRLIFPSHSCHSMSHCTSFAQLRILGPKVRILYLTLRPWPQI